MNNITELKPVQTVQNIINKFCWTIGMLPSSYKESLTYEEQLISIGHYLETTVIPALNNNAEVVSELQSLFIDLKNYVTNYFDNLDVQTEINNKLEEMKNDGQLQEIITQYLQINGVLSFDTINDMINSSNLVENSTVRTLGKTELNDGLGRFYKIEHIISANPDGINLINLNRDDLYARLINDIVYEKTLYLTPEQFGAIGNGITDDSTAFQNMINYINNIVPTKQFTDEASCLDYTKISFIFNGQYALSKPLTFSNTYGLILNNLKLIATNNFEGSYLLELNNVTRQTIINGCYLNGNMKANTCLGLLNYSLGIKIDNCEISHFFNYGIYASDKAHETIISNTKINQVEYGERYGNDTTIWDSIPTGNGTGLFLDTERHDNQFNNLVINYCKTNALTVLGSANLFNQCHFYGGTIQLGGNYNFINDSYFDGNILELYGFNYLKGCIFLASSPTHFIEIADTYENRWKYRYAYITDCIFRSETPTLTTPITFTGTGWETHENIFQINTNNNSFYQVQPFSYMTPNSYFPEPWKNVTQSGTSINGSYQFANLLINYGKITENGFVNFTTPFQQTVNGIFLMPEYSTSNSPFANTISNTRFYANNVSGNTNSISLFNLLYYTMKWNQMSRDFINFLKNFLVWLT